MVIKKIMCACAAAIMLTVSASAACCCVELCHNTAVDIEAVNEDYAIMLTQMAWGEARGCGDEGIEATMWCVMHRVDEWDQTVAEVITAPNQFFGYSSGNPVDEHILTIARQVLFKHEREYKPLLPEGFLWFSGDGRQNYFHDGNGNVWRVSE